MATQVDPDTLCLFLSARGNKKIAPFLIKHTYIAVESGDAFPSFIRLIYMDSYSRFFFFLISNLGQK